MPLGPRGWQTAVGLMALNVLALGALLGVTSIARGAWLQAHEASAVHAALEVTVTPDAVRISDQQVCVLHHGRVRESTAPGDCASRLASRLGDARGTAPARLSIKAQRFVPYRTILDIIEIAERVGVSAVVLKESL